MSRIISIITRTVVVGGSSVAASIYISSKSKYDELKEKISSFRDTATYQSKDISTRLSKLFTKSPNIKAGLVVSPTIEAVKKSTHGDGIDEYTIEDIEEMNESELRSRLYEITKEVIEIEQKYRKKLQNIQTENDELKKEMVKLHQEKTTSKPIQRKSLVEQYGEILDIISEIDKSSNIRDSLPRIVVVGDQSSGKTSVLEYIAKARIFPRGTGEMMTRAPVMVTMRNGSRHVVSFKNESIEYDLTNETDLSHLREEIETRMRKSIKPDKTVSSDVISLSMCGPGLPRMILVDLPGIINTVTSDLSPDAKDDIISLAKSYMSNPNSIIMCVQDGSVDAERSLVTDLVSSMDPKGSRTICVITKLDVAEKQGVKSERIQRLMAGKLFPMRAINYFAVISGDGNRDSDIAHIAACEEDFFKRSMLFRDGAIKPSQATSQTMIQAVSECFWDMVKSTIEQESDSIRSRIFGLEAEWRNSFPNIRELDRDELFDKARNDILDDAIYFCNTHAKEWEQHISESLMKTFIPFVFRDIYLKNALNSSKVGFDTQIDILLQNWLDNQLTETSVQLAKNIIVDKLYTCLLRTHHQYDGNNFNSLFKPIHDQLRSECLSNYTWSENNVRNLAVIQKNALTDGTVNERMDWDQACALMEKIVLDNKREVEISLGNILGPSKATSWMTWTQTSPDQNMNQKIAEELMKLMHHREIESPKLNSGEMSTVTQNLHSAGYSVKADSVNMVWEHVYFLRFYDETVGGIHKCKNDFRSGDFSQHSLGCNDVLLFHKIHKLLQNTVTTLRQQITSQEARRLENFVKNTLDSYNGNETIKVHLLRGKQVELAVELKKLHQVKSKLEKFIESLIKQSNI